MNVFRLLAALSLAGCAAPGASAPPAAALAEQAAVADVIARFSDATSERDLDALGGFFTPDAVWEASGDGLGFHLEGAAAIRASLASSRGRMEVVFQQIAPPVVRLDGEGRATARTSVTELLRVRATGVEKHLFGVYSDELVKRDGRWLFARRRFALRQSIDHGGQGAAGKENPHDP